MRTLMHVDSQATVTENDKYLQTCDYITLPGSYRVWPFEMLQSHRLFHTTLNSSLPWQLFQPALPL